MLSTLYAITIINVLVAAGFAIGGLSPPKLCRSRAADRSQPRLRVLHLRPDHTGGNVTIAAILWAPVVSVTPWLNCSRRWSVFDGYVGTQMKNSRTTWGPIVTVCCSQPIRDVVIDL